MPTLPADDKDTVLYFEDSGAPDGARDYVTVALVHGIIFHGIFRRMWPFAKKYGIRLVAINRRDYAGSTPYTQFEHDRLMGADEQAHRDALLQEGQELATFLEHLVKALEIPKVRTAADGTRKGGLAVLGWSSGNLPVLSMLGNALDLPESQQVVLRDYLRTSVIYDCPNFILGTKLPAGVYTPIHDTSIPPEELGPIFMVWVSTYFDAVPDMETMTEAKLAVRSNDYLAITDPARTPTIKRFSEDDIKTVTDFSIMERTPDVTWGVRPETYWANTSKALVETKGLWPDMKTLLIWSPMSTPDIVWAMKQLHDRICAAPDDGTPRRRLETVAYEGGNHFAHWDQPEKLVQILAQHV